MSLNRFIGNQFEIKDTCIEFMINNVSPRGNVKIKFNLKVITAEIKVPVFCGISDRAPEFVWPYQGHIHNPVKHLI